MQSDKQLKHWFAKYNKAYWDGKLPEHTVIYWEPPPGAHATTCPVYEVDFGQFVIKLDPAMRGDSDVWKIRLLHEMSHLALWSKHPKHQHGKLFKAERERIFSLGAYNNLL